MAAAAVVEAVGRRRSSSSPVNAGGPAIMPSTSTTMNGSRRAGKGGGTGNGRCSSGTAAAAAARKSGSEPPTVTDRPRLGYSRSTSLNADAGGGGGGGGGGDRPRSVSLNADAGGGGGGAVKARGSATLGALAHSPMLARAASPGSGDGGAGEGSGSSPTTLRRRTSGNRLGGHQQQRPSTREGGGTTATTAAASPHGARGMRRSFSSNSHDPSNRHVPHNRIEDMTTLKEFYTFGVELGHGAFGVVHEVASLNGSQERFACKTIQKEKAGAVGVQMLEIEIGVLKRVDHPNIVMLAEVFEMPNKMFLIMELCSGGMLSDWALTVSGQPAYAHDHVAVIIRRVTSAVAYLHDCGIIHRDLKLDNIMLKTKHSLDVKVCDFGLAAVHNREAHVQMVCGTASYMAPEVLANKGNYSPLCDVWSIGVILYLLLSGSIPFRPHGPDDSQLSAIKRTKLDFAAPIWGLVDKGVKALLQRLLHVDPASRMTAKELRDHPWISGRASEPGSKAGGADMANMTVLEMMKQFALEQAEEARLEAEAENGGAAGAGAGAGAGADRADRAASAAAGTTRGGAGDWKPADRDRRSRTASTKRAPRHLNPVATGNVTTSTSYKEKQQARRAANSRNNNADVGKKGTLNSKKPNYMDSTKSSRGGKIKEPEDQGPRRVAKMRLPPIMPHTT